jgi:hypothetical protein
MKAHESKIAFIYFSELRLFNVLRAIQIEKFSLRLAPIDMSKTHTLPIVSKSGRRRGLPAELKV